MPTHVPAPRPTNSQRLTTAPTREGFVSVSACTELAGTGIGAVCVERGRQTWPEKTIESHTQLTDFIEKTKNEATYARTIRYEDSLFPLQNQEKKDSRFALPRLFLNFEVYRTCCYLLPGT